MNWWLIVLAFVLGSVLTGLFMVRRVNRDVVTPAVAEPSAPKAAEPAAPKANAPAAPTLESGGATAATANASAASKFTAPDDADEEPYGAGSFRGPTAPAGYTVKGNDESKLYHSPESPSYGVTRAEVWFRDVETAEAAGFNRWDSGKSQRGRA